MDKIAERRPDVKAFSRLLQLLSIGAILLAVSLTWLYSERIRTSSGSDGLMSGVPTTEVSNISTDSPCVPPCWQGIVPGTHMTKDEVKHILSGLPDVLTIWEPSAESIAWRWKSLSEDRPEYNYITLDADTVQRITLVLGNGPIVADVLSEYDTPDATSWGVAGREDVRLLMRLYYPTRGLEFVAEVLDPLSEHGPVVEPTTPIYIAAYKVPAKSVEAWLHSTSPDLAAYLRAWPGYGKLPTLWSGDLPPRTVTPGP